MVRVSLLIFMVASSVSAIAEFRIWEDVQGNIWEAEFFAMNGNLVVLRDQAGRNVEFEPGKLCVADREYLEKVVPPALSIDVSKTTDNAGSGQNTERVQCLADIKQSDARSYTGPLTAVLAIVGEDIRTGAISLVSSKEHVFTLPENRGMSVEFRSDRVSFAKNSAKSGKLYGGYVLVVWDRFSNPVAIESNRDSYLEMATKLAAPNPMKRKTK